MELRQSGAVVGLPKADHFGDVDNDNDCLGLKPLPAEGRHGLLFVHPDPDGVIDLDDLLGEWFNDEFPTWNFPNVILMPFRAGAFLVRAYPAQGDPGPWSSTVWRIPSSFSISSPGSTVASARSSRPVHRSLQAAMDPGVPGDDGA